jgi:hypothetical protein
MKNCAIAADPAWLRIGAESSRAAPAELLGQGMADEVAAIRETPAHQLAIVWNAQQHMLVVPAKAGT